MIEFAIRLATSYCRGLRTPTREEVHDLLKRIGEFYKYCNPSRTQPIESIFVNRGLFSNMVEGNLDQTIESIWKRFQKHDEFLENRLGFNVENAIFFTKVLTRAVTNKMASEKPQKLTKLSKVEHYDFAFFVKPKERIVKRWAKAISFTQNDIVSLFPERLRVKLEKYLEFSSIVIDEFPKINNPLDPNPLFISPLIKKQDGYLIPVPYYLLHGLTYRLQKVLFEDPKYKGKFGKEKGNFLEEWANEELRLIFRSGKIFRGVKYKSDGSKPDADLIVHCGEYLIFVECTTKGIPQSSKQGDLSSIEETLAKSIRKCYHQALRAKRAYLEGRLKLQLATKPSRLLLMIVTDTQFPNLLSEFILSRHFGVDSYLSHLIEDDEYPYIISIYDLETMRYSTDENTFLRFIDERLSMYKTPCFLAYDEMDYFILFSKPEYNEIKEKLIQKQTTLSYVAHLPSPVVKPITFHVLIDIIGSDAFAVLKIGKKYDYTIASIAFSLLYEIYSDWRVVLNHLLFDLKGFKSLMKTYVKKGVKCKAVAWEGFYEYLDFCKKTGRTKEAKEAKELMKSVENGSMGQYLNVLIAFPTDIYDDAWKKALEESKKRVHAPVKKKPEKSV